MPINPIQPPINYNSGFIDLSPAFSNLGQSIESYQKQQLLSQALQQQQQQEQAQQQALQRLRSNPNAGFKDYNEVALMMPPDKAKNVLESWQMLDKQQQQRELSYNMQLISALKTNPQVGIDLLTQRAESAKNGGQMDQYQVYNAMAEAAKKDPLGVAHSVGILTAAIPGAKDALEGFTKIGGEHRAEELHPAALVEGRAKANKEASLAEQEAVKAAVAGELANLGLDEKRWSIKNLQNEISTRSAKLNLDAQTTAATVAEKMASMADKLTFLPEFAQKEVNASAVAAATAKQSAQQFNTLALRLDEQGGGWGTLSSASEWMKKAGGMQNGMTDLRNEYTRLKNNAAIKMLPPGPATDKDIQMVMSGFPPENADTKTMARFLRGMGKLQDIDAALNNAKTDWLTSNKGQLGRASSPFIAGDFAVKPGESFTDFSQRLVADVSKRYRSPDQKLEESIAERVSRIPTKSENASAQMNDVRLRADAILSGGR